jgi:hypothetical protein
VGLAKKGAIPRKQFYITLFFFYTAILKLLYHPLSFLMTAVPGNIQLCPADETIAPVHGEALYFVGITSSTALGSIEYTVTMISHYWISEFRQCQSATPGPPSWLCTAAGLIAVRQALSRWLKR